MYNRRRLITSGVAGILGMSLASLGIKQAHAETLNETPWGSLVFIGDAGPELIRPTNDEPKRFTRIVPDSVEWLGPDGTKFEMRRVESPVRAESLFFFYAHRVDDWYPRKYQRINMTYETINLLGNEMLDDMLHDARKKFESDYYEGYYDA